MSASDRIEDVRLTLPATNMQVVDALCGFAGVDQIVIYRTSGLEEDRLGTLHKPMVDDLVFLPRSVPRKFGPGEYRLVGKRGDQVVAVLLLDARPPSVIIPGRGDTP